MLGFGLNLINNSFEPFGGEVRDSLQFYVNGAFFNGGRVWYDISGNGYTSSLNSSVSPGVFPSYTSNFGGGITFTTASRQSATTGNILQYTTQESFTINVVAQVTKVGDGATNFQNTPVWGRGSFGNSVGIGAQNTDSPTGIKFRMGARTGSDTSSDKATLWPNGGINTSLAYNLCVVYDGGSQLLTNDPKVYAYANGELVYSSSVLEGGPGAFDTDDYASFQAESVTGGNAVSGSGTIYIASIYGKALSAAEVSQNYNAIKTRFNL
jgi:hypothetical protein